MTRITVKELTPPAGEWEELNAVEGVDCEAKNY